MPPWRHPVLTANWVFRPLICAVVFVYIDFSRWLGWSEVLLCKIGSEVCGIPHHSTWETRWYPTNQWLPNHTHQQYELYTANTPTRRIPPRSNSPTQSSFVEALLSSSKAACIDWLSFAVKTRVNNRCHPRKKQYCLQCRCNMLALISCSCQIVWFI